MLIVVKIGGSVMQGGLSLDLVSDIKDLLSNNQIILVHGGGKEVTKIASKLGKEQKFIKSPDGFTSRYTDKETIEIFLMVMAGRINKQIISTLQSQGVPAIGLSGFDGLLLQARRKKKLVVVDMKGRKRAVDGGYTGKICQVNTSLLKLLLSNGYVPVVAPVAAGEEFEPLNIDADRAAAYIGGALRADRLVLLTDVEGLNLDGKLVSKINLSQMKRVLPKIGRGMITKVYASMETLNQGVNEVTISLGAGKMPISSALKHKCGTVICRE